MKNRTSISIYPKYISDAHGVYKKCIINGNIRYYNSSSYARVYGNNCGEFDYISINNDGTRSYLYHRINGPALKISIIITKNNIGVINCLFGRGVSININKLVI